MLKSSTKKSKPLKQQSKRSITTQRTISKPTKTKLTPTKTKLTPTKSFLSTTNLITPRTTTTSIRSYAFKSTQEYDTIIDYKFTNPDRKLSLLGVPFALGQTLSGVDKGPSELRRGGLLERITNENWKVSDYGDLDVAINTDDTYDVRTEPDGTFKLKSAAIVSKVCQDTAAKTYEYSQNGNFMLTLGGDHSIAMGSIAGILKSRPNTGIIWVDAHADINTPYTSHTGNVHGMPVSFLMKHPDCANISTFEWLQDYPTLDPTKIVYIGLRDLDVGEKRTIKQYGIKAFTMQDVDRYGIGNVMDKAINHLTNERRLDVPIHLSIDIDGVDPMFAPSTGTRVLAGLTYREAYYICEAVAETGLLASMDLVEVNPTLGETQDAVDKTVKIANGLIATALGNRLL